VVYFVIIKTMKTLRFLAIFFGLLLAIPVFAQTPSVTNNGSVVQPALSVTVKWAKHELRNTNSDNSGLWYYEIASNGLVTRSRNETVYLILKDVTSGAVYALPDTGYQPGPLSFKVTFPSVANGNINPQQVQASPITPGHSYILYFSDTADGLNVINGAGGDLAKQLGTVPVIVNPGSDVVNPFAATLQTRTNNAGATKSYYQVQGNITQDIPGKEVVFIARHTQSGVTTELGRTRMVQGQFKVPADTVSFSDAPRLSEGSYDIDVLVDGNVIQSKSLPNPIVEQSGQTIVGSGGIALNATQIDVEANGLVPNCGYNLTDGGQVNRQNICGFAHIIELIQRIIEFIFLMVLPIAALVFAYAGFLYMTSGGDSGRRGAAKKAMINMVIGVLVVMAAWLIIKTVLVAIGVDENAGWLFFDLS